jgi:hypothetical protein
LTFVRNGDEIWTMGASGGNASSAASGRSPAWASDGRLVAFVSSADGAIRTVRPTAQMTHSWAIQSTTEPFSNSTGSLGSPKLSADSVDRGTRIDPLAIRLANRGWRLATPGAAALAALAQRRGLECASEALVRWTA